MSDEELSDHEFDTFEDDTFKDDEEEIEDLEEPINRNKGNWIYNDMNEKELREESVEFLSHYIKHKSNRQTAENEIYKQSFISDKFNNDLYINLLSTFVTTLVDKGLKHAYDSLLNSKFSWNHPEFEEIKSYEDKEVAKRLRPIKIEEGIYTCKKCGGKHTQSYEIQMRRADEPATVFIECVNPKCRNKWKIN
jgi:DNA-directed RNA polymerase subunit M/transcription elongation factor TFIIS